MIPPTDTWTTLAIRTTLGLRRWQWTSTTKMELYCLTSSFAPASRRKPWPGSTSSSAQTLNPPHPSYSGSRPKSWVQLFEDELELRETEGPTALIFCIHLLRTWIVSTAMKYVLRKGRHRAVELNTLVLLRILAQSSCSFWRFLSHSFLYSDIV